MTNPVLLHCNCVEQGQSIPDMCRLAVAWGFDGLEFRYRRSGVTENPADYLDALASACEGHGVRHVVFGGPGPNLAAPEAGTREREAATYIGFLEQAAKRFELSVCNTMAGPLVAPGAHAYEFDKNGSAFARAEHWQWATEGFQVIGDAAKRLGLRLGFETHNGFLHDLPAPTLRLIERIARPSVGANLDVGNIVLHPDGTSPEEAYAVLKDHLVLVHLKNLYKLPVQRYFHFIACPLAEGIINHRALLRLLLGGGYRGPLVLECPREGDREEFARADLRYLRRLLEGI